MEDNILKHGMRFLLKQKRRKRWQKVVGFLACLVVFCTSYALILPAITMEATAYCGKEEHVHDDSCYETSKTLICGLEEQTETVAAENLAETASGESETQETETIGAAHVHTEECYQYEKVLVCTLEEHTHTQECYSDKNADVEAASDWENTLPALTGKRAADLILVAESQIGYRESGINYEVVGTDTLKGYTRYGAWYGQPYGDWSGMFAAFCLNYAGIPQSIFPYDADCQQWADILAQRGMYAAAGSYTPKAGDIAFLDTDGTPGIERVGIIRDVSEEGAITTIEGDAQDTVQYGNYTLNSENVKGYGILSEEDTPETTAEETSQATPEEDAKMLEADGEDYKITVTYGENAGIPDGAILKVSEYSQDSEEYATRFEQANTVLLEQDGSCIRRARFFNISIMDGETEIEPESTVKVEISQSSEITEAAGDIVITHATDEGTEVISEVEQTQEENGYVTTSFETESFSDYGTISAGESITVGVGDTVTLGGTASNGGTVNKWTLSSDGVVTIEQSGTNDATITGTNAGTVTITHEYSTKKNKTAKETFTVTVTDNGGSGGDDTGEETEKEAAGTDYTVTVKGNKNVLTDDVTLHVEDYNETESDYEGYFEALIGDLQNQFEDSQSITEEDFDFLHMYHIYLTKEGTEGEYIPEGNINLQVTITYANAPGGWPSKNGNLYVGHYKKVKETISSEAISDDDSTSIGVKQIKVSGNSITFHIKSFSVFPVASFSSDSNGSLTGGSGITKTGSIAEEQGLASLSINAANKWQVVDKMYDGNSVGDKNADTHNAVRVQKNIVPTGNENEFKVYLSVDYNRDAIFSYLLQNSGMAIKTSGNVSVGDEENGTSHAKHFEAAWTSGGETENNAMVALPEKSSSHTNPFTFKITAFGKTYSVVRYTANNSFNNGRAAIRLGYQDWLIIAEAANGRTSFEGELTDEQATKIIESSIGTEIGTMIDEMGQNIDVIELNGYTGNAKIDENGNIDWSHLIDSSHLTLEDGWYVNAAEMVYTIRFTPTISTGLDEQTNDIYPISSDVSENVETNAKAELNYMYPDSNGSATKNIFSVDSPVVRGMLYTLKIKKTDTDGNPLEGAEFGLYTTADATGEPVDTAKSNSDGIVIFNSVDLNTEYWVKELGKMEGYIENKNVYSLGAISTDYTNSPNSFIGQGKNKSLIYEEIKLTVENEPEGRQIILRKTDSQGAKNYLSGATFEIYDTDGESAGTLNNISDENGYITPSDGITLSKGEYYLKETKAPEGYVLPAGDFKLEVTDSGAILYRYNAEAEEHYGNADASIFEAANDGSVEVIVTNNKVQGLPATGGAGTLPYTFGGLGLILASGLMYGYSMRRRRERRSM